MSPDRLAGSAFRPVADVVVTRSGRDLAIPAAMQLFAFLGRRAIEQRSRGDRAGALHCWSMASDLARAIGAARDWRRAAAPTRLSADRDESSQPAALELFARRVKRRRDR